jgi:hypothetical protein
MVQGRNEVVLSAVLLCQTEGFVEQHTILYQKFKIDTKNKRKGLSTVILEALSYFIK